MAFFHERVVPTERPRRRTLPLTCTMLTALTWTFLLAKACSTARLISILFAVDATSKTYLPWSPWTVLFSDTTGRMIVLNASSAMGGRLLLVGWHQIAGERAGKLLDRGLGQDEPRKAEHVQQVETIRRDHVDVIQVARGAQHRVRTFAEDDERTF